MKKNETGFSLVVVLFAVVLFSTIGLSLFTLNFNNAKQIKITKEQLVATDLAEMGIIYYETLFTEHSFNIFNEAIENTKNYIERENQKKMPGESKIQINSDTILDHLILDKNKFINNSNLKINEDILDNPNDNFKIISHNLINSPNEITIVFKSEGYTSNGKKAELTGDVTLDFEQYIDNYLSGNPALSVVTKEIPKIDEIEKLKNIQNKCPSNSFDSLINCNINRSVTANKNSTYSEKIGGIEGKFIIDNNTIVRDSIVYVKNDIAFNQSFDVTNSIFYSEGSGNFGNAGLNNTILYVENGGNFGNVNTGINDSRVYSNGNFIFGNQNNNFIKNSEFIINGKFETGNLNTSIDNSYFFVNGNINLGHFNQSLINSQIFSQGNFTMDNLNSNMVNSKIIINGNFKSGNFNQNIDNTTVICAGSFTGGIVQYRNNNPSKNIFDFKSNPELFKEGGICSFNAQPGVELKIDPTSLLNNLNVEYN